MNWMQRLCDTYTHAERMPASAEQSIPPIRHTKQNAHINIVLSDQAEFLSARVLKKNPLLLPTTEASEARANADAPHGLADKIQYVAKDYPLWGGRKKSFFESYSQQLRAWCRFGAPEKVQIVHEYVSKGEVLTDLVCQAHVFDATPQRTIRTTWSAALGPMPEIFSSLPRENGAIEPGSAVICWSVQLFNEQEQDTWHDQDIWESWVRFQSQKDSQFGVCQISGRKTAVARLHPSKLRHPGDKAKLISANDLHGMTFRGRFTDSAEALTIGSEVTQKAHNTMRWLIEHQGVRNGDQVCFAWAPSGKALPQPLAEPMRYHAQPAGPQTASRKDDLGPQVTQSVRGQLHTLERHLKPTEPVSVMVLDSATPGRMAVAYFRDMTAESYFTALRAWFDHHAWFQRVSWEPSSASPPNEKRLSAWAWLPPSPLGIAVAAYGSDPGESIKKKVFNDILTSIVDIAPLPAALVRSAIRRAGMPQSMERWEWIRLLGIACGLYRGYRARHPDLSQRKEYTMDLEHNTGRDYCFGRMLAIADKVESIALSAQGSNRPTTAIRLMQRFATHPANTWKHIEEALLPHLLALQSRHPSLVDAYRDLIGQSMEALHALDGFSDQTLEGEYLLGFHLQRRWLEQHRYDKGEWVSRPSPIQRDSVHIMPPTVH